MFDLLVKIAQGIMQQQFAEGQQQQQEPTQTSNRPLTNSVLSLLKNEQRPTATEPSPKVVNSLGNRRL